MVDVERWLSYKGTCHVILLAKLHDMYLYKTDNFFHINHYLKSVSKVAFLHRFYCSVNFFVLLSMISQGVCVCVCVCVCVFKLEFYSPVNIIKVMSSRSVYLTTLLLGRLSPLSG